MQLSQPAKIAAACAAGAGLAGYAWLKTQSDDIPRDLWFIYMLAMGKRNLNAILASKEFSCLDYWNESVEKNLNSPFITYIHTDNTTVSYTYKQADLYANRVANWGVSQGLKKGDVVSLMMENRPEFVFIWAGLAKIGVVTAFINTNLRLKPLHHCVKISYAKAHIIGKEHLNDVEEMRKSNFHADEPLTGQFFLFGDTHRQQPVQLPPGFQSFHATLPQSEKAPPPPAVREATDPLFLIYTSGTTGLPKASKITGLRFFMAGYTFSKANEITPADRIYCALPLYHSSATLIGISMTIFQGASFVIRRKLSVQRFFVDCTEQKCTAALYIGEVCRYLLANTDKSFDRKHRLRIMIGNGLRPDVWKAFTERFGVQRFGEFYASTEGNASLINLTGEYASVGFIPKLINRFYPVKIAKFDVEKDELVRRKNGLCIECKPNEVGELLGLVDPSDPLRAFAEYSDKAATEKKLVRNVLVKGDCYFRTGDLLRQDARGYFYFVDRIGDTFRYKGENVSTSEVEDCVNLYPDFFDTVVYGVKVPGQDGKAGMASVTIQPEKQFKPEDFYKFVLSQLPAYAAPLFLRIKPAQETTGTFKHVKTTLVKEGFDPSQTSGEPVYMRDDPKKTYVLVDKAKFEALATAQQSKL